MYHNKLIAVIVFVTIASRSAAYTWQNAQKGVIPANAAFAGIDINPLYAGRIMVNGSYTAVKIKPSTNAAWYSKNGVEYMVQNQGWQYVTAWGFEWKSSANGLVPPYAVNTRVANNPQPNYIARAIHNGKTVVGYVDQAKKALVAPFNGGVVIYKKYEVLTSS